MLDKCNNMLYTNKLLHFAKEKVMRKGFTLAEVLITLGIIGVVAALTMPGLIANYQKKAYVTQLRKSLAVWENAIAMMKVEAGDTNARLSDTELSVMQSNYAAGNVAEQARVEPIIKKYFNIVKIDNSPIKYQRLDKSSESTNNDLKWYMNDGSIYMVNVLNANTPPAGGTSFYGIVYIDVNGNKGPNTWGRDAFSYFIDVYGHLVPRYSSYTALVSPMTEPNWLTDTSRCGVAGSSDITGVSGLGCAARLQETDWVMDY